jgi:hypothetical protein
MKFKKVSAMPELPINPCNSGFKFCKQKKVNAKKKAVPINLSHVFIF